MRLLNLATVIVVLAIGAAAPALAGKGGHGGGGGNVTSGSCTFSGDVVYGTGLPTDQVVNFMVTDSSGTWGFVLGYTHDGAWSVNVPTPTGPTTYEFVSRTFGPDGSKYNVFESCSV
jgi:hypothetical protein